MKLAIIYPSHRPHYVDRSYRTSYYLEPLDYKFCIIGMDPVYVGHLNKLNHRLVRWDLIAPPKVPGLVEMIKWYRIGMMMGKDAEYFLFVDDDHHYVPGSGQYYQMCIDYMDENPQVGFMTTHKDHGGLPIEAKENPDNGLVSLGRGMFMRNIPEFFFSDEEVSYPGAMAESLLCYKMMSWGYTFVKRAGCPTLKDPSKKMGDGENGDTYSYAHTNQNLGGYIRRRWDDPTWYHDSQLYPAGLLSEHDEAFAERWGK